MKKDQRTTKEIIENRFGDNYMARAREHIVQHDHDWYEVEKMRFGHDPVWVRLIESICATVRLTGNGGDFQYTPIFFPIFIKTSQGGFSSTIQASIIGELIDPYFPKNQEFKVYPQIKSYHKIMGYSHPDRYGLTLQATIDSIDNRDLIDIAPFDPQHDTTILPDGVIEVRAFIILMLKTKAEGGAKSCIPPVISNETLVVLAQKLQAMQSDPENTLVYVNQPLSGINFDVEVKLSRAYFDLHSKMKDMACDCKVEYVGYSQDGRDCYLNVSFITAHTDLILTVPSSKIEIFNQYLEGMEQQFNIRINTRKTLH